MKLVFSVTSFRFLYLQVEKVAGLRALVSVQLALTLEVLENREEQLALVTGSIRTAEEVGAPHTDVRTGIIILGTAIDGRCY